MNPVLIVALVVAALLIFLLLRSLGRKELPSHQQIVTCPACGWKGTVSRYAGRCPKCNTGVGERRAQQRPAS